MGMVLFKFSKIFVKKNSIKLTFYFPLIFFSKTKAKLFSFFFTIEREFSSIVVGELFYLCFLSR